MMDQFLSRLCRFSAQVPDWNETVEAVARGRDPVIPTHIARYIKEADTGPALLYLMAKHPEILAKLSALPPENALIEMSTLVYSFMTGAVSFGLAPLDTVEPAHLFHVGAAMIACMDRCYLNRWTPETGANPN
jgi:hypothetical protein